MDMENLIREVFFYTWLMDCESPKFKALTFVDKVCFSESSFVFRTQKLS